MPFPDITTLADLIIPDEFQATTLLRALELNAFYQSGVFAVDPDIDIGTGTTINLPFYNPLGGEEQIYTDVDDVALDNVTEATDTAVVLARMKGWGRAGLTRALRSDDPLDAIETMVAEYWAARMQAVALSLCRGVSASKAGEATPVNFLDISALLGASAYLDGESFIDATSLFGDRSTSLSVMAMHSATEGWLRKNDLLEDIRDSEGRLVMTVFQSRRLIVDDAMPFSGTGADRVFDTYLTAPGAISYVEDSLPDGVEFGRDALKNGGTDYLVTRRKFCMHLRGMQWTPGAGVPANVMPSNTELAAAANWSRVWDPRRMPFVTLRHKIG